MKPGPGPVVPAWAAAGTDLEHGRRMGGATRDRRIQVLSPHAFRYSSHFLHVAGRPHPSAKPPGPEGPLAVKKGDAIRSIRIVRVGQAARDFKTDDEAFQKLLDTKK